MTRKGLVLIWLGVLLSAVLALFWYSDWIYQLPTPVPENYKPVKTGTVIALENRPDIPPTQPVLLHFFNPDCPCSRFNKPHFLSLVRQFGQQVAFVVVVMSTKSYSVRQIQEKIGLDIPVLFDASLATACGVYSTPQAALLDAHHRLYYRGNYNRSRYCTDEKTSYARIALTELLQKKARVNLDPLALTAYGCGVTYCTNDSLLPKK
ncbi:redoxin domain-containing protein [Larkinella insperata]|uniref:Redoxin domain-containing protein n=1 Tax=Larkinella insperata TaxID=332158 RepID=A0ABW3Q0I4_9BACT|nr:redoxin domain-containing protein [Larkinella insperata]